MPQIPKLPRSTYVSETEHLSTLNSSKLKSELGIVFWLTLGHKYCNLDVGTLSEGSHSIMVLHTYSRLKQQVDEVSIVTLPFYYLTVI